MNFTIPHTKGTSIKRCTKKQDDEISYAKNLKQALKIFKGKREEMVGDLFEKDILNYIQTLYAHLNVAKCPKISHVQIWVV